MGMIKAILVLIIGILLILEQVVAIPYVNWIVAILVLIIGIVMLMNKKK